MKKIILGLFLILGALSFASPSFVDVNKIKQNSYEIRDDEDDFFTFVKSTDEAGISVAFNVIEDTNSKEVSEMIKSTAPDSQKFLSSINNKRAYVNKFADNENGGFTYSFVAKNTKIKDCYISILYATDIELSNTELNNAVDKVLNEVESYLK